MDASNATMDCCGTLTGAPLPGPTKPLLSCFPMTVPTSIFDAVYGRLVRALAQGLRHRYSHCSELGMSVGDLLCGLAGYNEGVLPSP
jgi:hypothetical protein